MREVVPVAADAPGQHPPEIPAVQCQRLLFGLRESEAGIGVRLIPLRIGQMGRQVHLREEELAVRLDRFERHAERAAAVAVVVAVGAAQGVHIRGVQQPPERVVSGVEHVVRKTGEVVRVVAVKHSVQQPVAGGRLDRPAEVFDQRHREFAEEPVEVADVAGVGRIPQDVASLACQPFLTGGNRDRAETGEGGVPCGVQPVDGTVALFQPGAVGVQHLRRKAGEFLLMVAEVVPFSAVAVADPDHENPVGVGAGRELAHRGIDDLRIGGEPRFRGVGGVRPRAAEQRDFGGAVVVDDRFARVMLRPVARHIEPPAHEDQCFRVLSDDRGDL